MRNKYFVIIPVLFSLLFIVSCSEVQDEISQPPILEGVHGTNNLTPSSAEFHGKLMGDNGLESCKKCHDANFSGGPTNISCLDCHPSVNVHKEGLFSPTSPNFHGKYLVDNNFEMTECMSCHGLDYQGGVSSPTCVECHSGISVHKAGIVSPSSPDFHGKYLQNKGWSLSECSTCHGADYSGGLVSNSCNTCHSGSNGPESCNTCHGDFSDESKIAPPRDLSGNTQTSAKGVGAHSSHLFENMLSSEISCYECHPQVESADNYVVAHINGLPAEMKFGSIASSGLSAPTYNNDLSCANTFCHGNFSFTKSESANKYAYTNSEIVGNNFTPIWNKVDGTQAACGTCHGEIDEAGNFITAQPVGHFGPSVGTFTLDQCPVCHTATFNEDGTLNKLVHMNGEKNLDN